MSETYGLEVNWRRMMGAITILGFILLALAGSTPVLAASGSSIQPVEQDQDWSILSDPSGFLADWVDEEKQERQHQKIETPWATYVLLTAGPQPSTGYAVDPLIWQDGEGTVHILPVLSLPEQEWQAPVVTYPYSLIRVAPGHEVDVHDWLRENVDRQPEKDRRRVFTGRLQSPSEGVWQLVTSERTYLLKDGDRRIFRQYEGQRVTIGGVLGDTQWRGDVRQRTFSVTTLESAATRIKHSRYGVIRSVKDRGHRVWVLETSGRDHVLVDVDDGIDFSRFKDQQVRVNAYDQGSEGLFETGEVLEVESLEQAYRLQGTIHDSGDKLVMDSNGTTYQLTSRLRLEKYAGYPVTVLGVPASDTSSGDPVVLVQSVTINH